MYTPIALDPKAPAPFREYVAGHVDMQFGDVHTMLRLPIAALEMHSAQNFAATSVVLGIASGLSTVIYEATRRDSADRFRRFFAEFYPWDEEPTAPGPLEGGGLRRLGVEAAADVLYDAVRNPLVHALGTRTVTEGDREVMARESSRFGLTRQPSPLGGRDGLPERLIEELERDVRPLWLVPTLQVDAHDFRFLTVDALYRGVRVALMRASAREDAMRSAFAFLNR